MNALDIERIRKDFPILSRKVKNGKPLVYLDNAATTQKPLSVIEAIRNYYLHYNANVHRGIHTLSEEATRAYEEAREKIARFIHARSRSEIIFVRNATEAINLVAYAWGRREIGKGDKIALSIMEHHSNIVPWQLLAKEKGAQLRYCDIDEEGKLKEDEMEAILDEGPKLLTITHMSNVLGTINPVKKLAKRAHDRGALVLVDAAQSAPHMPIDVQELGCDFLVLSGHKMLGPTGIGALYAKEEILREIPPFLGGGDMIREVRLYDAVWNFLPWKFEAGTPNIEAAIGWGAAIDYLIRIGMKRVRRHEEEMVEYALQCLEEVKGIKVYGPRKPEDKGGIVSFTLEGVHAHDIATILDEEGIAIRAGHHCAMPLMERLGIPASARASFYLYNTPQEVEALVMALKKVREVFGP